MEVNDLLNSRIPWMDGLGCILSLHIAYW